MIIESRGSQGSWKALRNLLGLILISSLFSHCAAMARDEAEILTETGNSSHLFILGPVTLNLPTNLVGPMGKVSNTRGAHLSIRLLLPDLEPETKYNESEFLNPAMGRKIFIFLEYPANIKDPHDALYGHRGLISSTDPVNPFIELHSEIDGFHKYKTSLGQFIYVADRSDFFLTCIYVNPTAAGCNHVEKIFGTVMLRYSFLSTYLDSSLLIENRVQNFLNSLVQH